MKRIRLIAYYYFPPDPALWCFADPLDDRTWPRGTMIHIWEGDSVPDPMMYLMPGGWC